MKKVLFVCTGNTCRSPMAEAWLRHLCEKDGRSDILAMSAGMDAYPGENASLHAQEAVKEAGGDLSGHSSRQLSEAMVLEADMIAVMTGSHRYALLKLMPEMESKTFLLTHFSQETPEGAVPDPYGGDLESYRKCFRTIREAVDNLYLSLTKHNPTNQG